ncbi:MAG: glycosyltransferase family 8 protein [Lachnospiraceae bacterium]|nr:glycosyltransferase family 8 protein [Lachnospiraceae bacterium]
MTDIQRFLPPHHRNLLVLGVTHTWAFAAGTLLLALSRHNPHLDADILLLHDEGLSAQDKDILSRLGARCHVFSDPCDCLTSELLALYSPLCLAKFLCFELLDHYDAIAWLDADCLIQDSIADLWSFGPLSLAPEDVFFYDDQKARGARINGTRPLPGIDPDRPNLNSGVFVLNAQLPNPHELAEEGRAYLLAHKDVIRFADQAAFNVFAHQLMRERPDCFKELPVDFNCHPRNPASLYAPIVHAFGAYKLWNDGLTAAAFPEWQRDYARWLALGGSPWHGVVENSNYKDMGTFALLTSFYETMKKSEESLRILSDKLAQEHRVRARLEEFLQRFSDS